MSKRSFESLYWGALILLFVPILLLGKFEAHLKSNISYDLSGNTWSAYNSGETQPFFVGKFPKDLKFERGRKGNEYIFETEIDVKKIQNMGGAALIFGRVADSDRVAIDGCVVGETGFKKGTDLQDRWFWNAMRAYSIPEKCIDRNKKSKSVLRVFIKKWGGPSIGIFGGPLGFGPREASLFAAHRVQWFRAYPALILAILAFGIGIYYAFVFLLVPARRHNGVFALNAIGLAFYSSLTSALPFWAIDSPTILMRLLFFAAAFTGTSFLWFLVVRFSEFPKWPAQVIAIASAVALLIGLPMGSLKGVYQVYEAWHGVFLPILLISFFIFFRLKGRNRDENFWRYQLGFCLFVLAVAHDMVVTYAGVPRGYLITFGYMCFTVSVALSLAKEYADAFLHVEQQVSDRTRDLAMALEQLKSLDEMKARFFANISHDFKTPITVALGSLEEARKNDGNVDALQPAERSLNHLLSMIGDLLDTVKAESGTLSMQWESAPLAGLLKLWSSSHQLLCRRKGVEFVLSVGQEYENLKIPVDVNKFRRVIDNLLSNAVKFTDAGTVGLNFRTDEAKAYIEIIDSGIGIPEDERDKVFDRFFQSSRTSLQAHGGSGIGLSFAKEVVEMHNGNIWIEEAETGGSKFIVALPLSQDVEVTGEHRLEEVETDDVRGSLNVAYPPEKPKREEIGRPTVLAAEDNPEVAQIVVSGLAEEYNVHFAADGKRALDRLMEEKFDCLVTDIKMPRMRGDELVIELRSLARTRSLPIVVLSAHGEDELVSSVLRSGANDYVTKPFKREILLARVRTQIESHKTAEWISKNEKVIELGFLAGGMAHQIRNGLNSLSNQVSYQKKFVEKMLVYLKEAPEAERNKLRGKIAKSSEAIERAMERIERLTGSVQAYSTGSTEKTEIQIADSVDVAVSLHSDEIKKRAITIEKEDLENLTLRGYAGFHEVFVNLIGNAVKACPEDGTGKVEIYGKDFDDEMEIVVKDNGHGIRPEVLPNLCKPFFTTKAPGEGTGLGLYVVRDIIEGHHGGQLNIQSGGEDQGAMFTIRIPKEAPDSDEDSNVSIHNVPVS